MQAWGPGASNQQSLLLYPRVPNDVVSTARAGHLPAPRPLDPWSACHWRPADCCRGLVELLWVAGKKGEEGERVWWNYAEEMRAGAGGDERPCDGVGIERKDELRQGLLD